MELPENNIGPWVSMISKALYDIRDTRAPVENWQESSLIQTEEFKFFQYCVNWLPAAGGASQNFQDAWAGFRHMIRGKPGFFVEFGAFDGIYSSNTYRLQEKLGWSGILAEPNPQWAETLRYNRTRSGIDISFETDYCIGGQTGGQVNFSLTDDPLFAGVGVMSPKQITLPTLSLNDLLVRHGAPSYIDFMSIDTEGSEYEILRSFDFHKWNVRNICVEHNFLPARGDIYRLMTANGYRREFEAFSRWDDFYTKEKP